MSEMVVLTEKPQAEELYMLAGWRQWADAGSVSSELPPYLIEQLAARKIGEIKPGGFYFFQVPGMHHFLRPEIKLEDGYRQSLRTRTNDIYYASLGRKGLVLFIGDEPHLDAERYAEAFFEVAKTLGVKRVASVGGVYGPVPYDKERQISCTYSLPWMKEELSAYAVRFSNYEGGVSLGSYLADRAEQEGIEYVVLYAFAPMYDFSQLSPRLQGVSIEEDYKAWYDIMRRLNHMLGLELDLSDLEQRSARLATLMAEKIDEVIEKAPHAGVREYLEKVGEEFTETPFMPLDDIWSRELGDLLDDLDE